MVFKDQEAKTNITDLKSQLKVLKIQKPAAVFPNSVVTVIFFSDRFFLLYLRAVNFKNTIVIHIKNE